MAMHFYYNNNELRDIKKYYYLFDDELMAHHPSFCIWKSNGSAAEPEDVDGTNS